MTEDQLNAHNYRDYESALNAQRMEHVEMLAVDAVAAGAPVTRIAT